MLNLPRGFSMFNRKYPDQSKLDEYLKVLATERRGSERSDCMLEAVTQINGSPRDTVYLANISDLGALLFVTPGTFLPDEFQLLGLSKNAVDCRLVWQKDRDAGIAFKDKLTDRQFNAFNGWI
jgi:hypothetical protein